MSVRRVVERMTPRPAPRVILGTAAGEVSGGRVVSSLEGGYDLDALAASVAAYVGEMARLSA